MGEEEAANDSAIEHVESPAESTRRQFLKVALGAGISMPVYKILNAGASEPIVENSVGMLVSDSTRCVGCKLCELACTEFNEGRSQPSLARLKVSRNYNFGPRGQQAGLSRGMGEFGNLRIVQDVCLQCPHPVPCATACPNGAIVLDEKTRARIVDTDRCEGCEICKRACPWEMMTFDYLKLKASKCFLCNGKPECVEICPTTALRYVPWLDLTRAVPVRQSILPNSDYKSAECDTCHTIRR